jgi:glycosyltransferase involved in cell wall biosynthesis
VRAEIPLISVVMTTYQHEKYIAEAIQSILDQTFENFELIIVNDGSTDRTDEIIRDFHDDRILYIYQENQGPSAATNNGIIASRSKYIALMSGDDACYPQRLAIQYQYLNNTDRKIVFSWVDLIDDDSNVFVDEEFTNNFFNHPHKNRSEVLNHFFLKGNYLCAITALVEKEILISCGLFNLASIQLQDFDMWIGIVAKYDLHIIEDKLAKYRIRANSSNLSANPDHAIRRVFEDSQIYKNMFNNVPIQLFKSSFADRIGESEFQTDPEYELAKAFLYLTHETISIQAIGAEKLFDSLQDREVLSIARSKYKFGLPELYHLTKNIDTTNIKKQAELGHYQSQLHQTQSELARSESQLQQTQSELARSESQLQQTQAKLVDSHLQLQQTQSDLVQSQAQFQQLQVELVDDQAQLQQSQANLVQFQADLVQSQAQFQQLQVELVDAQSQLQQSQSELAHSQSTIVGMESSKFWKTRQAYFAFGKMLGFKK